MLIFGAGLYLGVANAQNDNSVLLDKAASLIELGDPKSAIPLLKEVLEGDPDNIKALKNLSLAYFKLNMHAESGQKYTVRNPNKPTFSKSPASVTHLSFRLSAKLMGLP